jgi:predicted MPP superfamily phosphohydrolase
MTFVGTFLVVLGLMQWRVWRAYKSWVGRAHEQAFAGRWLLCGRIALLAVNLLLLARAIFDWSGHYDHPVAQAFAIYPGAVIFGGFVLSFIVISIADLGRLAGSGIRKVLATLPRRPGTSGKSSGEVRPAGEFNPVRRRLLMKMGGLGAAGTLGAVPLLSYAATARDYRINRLTLEFPALPAELDGLTVAQVSDIHSGVFMTERDMAEIFNIVNGLRPDMVLLTGDQVDSADSQIPPLARVLPMLKPDLGVYACLGNHDHFATAEKVTAAMEQNGIAVLNNAHRILRVNGASFAVAGIDDAGRGARNFARLDRALEGIPPNTFRILLTHRPDMFVEAKKAGVEFSLAGHTHGGQVGIEAYGIKLNPVYLVYEYARGLYREDGSTLYVNVGVGMVGVPIRFVRPEIALFTLRPRSAAVAQRVKMAS